MKAGKKAYVVGLGEVIVVEFGKGLTARVKLVGKRATEQDVLKEALLAKPPKPTEARS